MPISNLGRLYPTTAQMNIIDQALAAIENELMSFTNNLTAEDRQRYGSVNETNKLFVNKVLDYHSVQSSLSSPDVDWVQFRKSYDARNFADSRLDRFRTVVRMFSDFKITHDYHNFQDGLTDYDYSKYKSGTKAAGYTEKVDELRQFFPNTGSTASPAPAAE